MEENGKIKVLSSIAMIGDLVHEIGKDRIDNLVLITGELDPHSYELVKGDGEKLQRADLIFYNGLGLEHGAAIAQTLHTTKNAISVGDAIAEKVPDKILSVKGTVDPHIWMDVSLWMQATYPIAEHLSLLDPEGKEFYQKNAEALRQEMEKMDRQVRTILHTIPSERRYLITSHDAFHYFTRSYLAEEGETHWRERFAAPEGLAPDGQLSSVDIQKIIEYMKKHQIQVIFPESNVSKDSLKKITSSANQMGLQVSIASKPLYGDAEPDNGYLSMMEQNARTIAYYLKDSHE